MVMPARNIFSGVLILIIASLIAYWQATGKYGPTALLAASSFFILGFVSVLLAIQPASKKRIPAGVLFPIFTSLCFFLTVYFINRQTNGSALLIAAVYTSCFLLPFILLENWYLYKLAFQPADIKPWMLPVPYVKSNAVSLHLNSISFTFRISVTTGGEEKDYPVTAPGIKTLGTVFSELVYENRNTGEPTDFSDVKDGSYSWAFYVRELGGLSSRPADANLSLLDNRLKSNAVVTVQRQ